MSDRYFAHSGNRAGSGWESLEEHIRLVAERAGGYADCFGAKDEAIVAGLLHDLGKYSDLFRQRLKGETSGVDHWTAGAVASLGEFKQKAVAAALAIQGHHIGLQEGSAPSIRETCDIARLARPDRHPLGLRLTESCIKTLIDRFGTDGFVLPSAPEVSLYDFITPPVAAMLDARMLFSSLVDADYIETEAHFGGRADGTKIYRPSGPSLQAAKAMSVLLAHVKTLEGETEAATGVREMRGQLLAACLNKGTAHPGLFTLTAPTGSGKTLAMLAFALKHATVNESLRRIVVIVPFLSIIEQNAKVYRDLLEPDLGPHYVLEHHSLANLQGRKESGDHNHDNEDKAVQTAQLLSENWDAPLVLTTSVQLFESLFANRPGKCRKLHRLANSIILFDEVQTLPPHIAVPSLAALSHLVKRYGCTVVFSTATQPAFEHLHNKVTCYAQSGWKPNSIAEASRRVFDHARRVRIDWQVDKSRTWSAITDELAEERNSSSLCIVNLKRHAQKLVGLLRERIGDSDLFHLSTNMCPAHREAVMVAVRKRLGRCKKLPCRLISTQCIEAGVDVDFPVTWRALGPLDAIAQAAGRCNREGRLASLGRMVVFLPERDYQGECLYPPGGYKHATETTYTLLRMKMNEAQEKGVPFEEICDIYDPTLFGYYYRLLYDLTDAIAVDRDLEDALQRRSFVDAAKYYSIIDKDSINVLVPYAKEIALFGALNERIESDGRLTRQWLQEARPLTVSLYRPKDSASVWNYLDAIPLAPGRDAGNWFIYRNMEDYDPLLGLTPPDEVEAWMC